jgi:hypothetical protein
MEDIISENSQSSCFLVAISASSRLPAGRAALETSSMAAILREASTSLRGRPAVAGRFLAVDIFMRVNLHQEAPIEASGFQRQCDGVRRDPRRLDWRIEKRWWEDGEVILIRFR